MVLDIVASFLLAYAEEGYKEFVSDIFKIAHRYVYQGTFFKDVIIVLPIYEMRRLSPSLEIFSLIKIVRVLQLFDFVSKKKVMPMVRSYFANNLKKVLADPSKNEDNLRDHNYVTF